MPWKDEQGERIAHWSNAQIVDALIPPEYRGGQGEFNYTGYFRFIKHLFIAHTISTIAIEEISEDVRLVHSYFITSSTGS